MKLKFGLLALLFSACNYQAMDHATWATIEETKSFWDWDGRRVHYVEQGKGNKHIILLHGFAAHSYTWRNQIETLVKKGYHVWAPDFLGFGLSDKPEEIEYGPDLYHAQILAFMDAMGIKKAHLVGHSMGGVVSLSLASRAPERFTSLVLIDSTGYEVDLPFAFSVTKKMGKLLMPLYSRALIYQVLKQIYYDSSKITEEQIDAYWLPFTTEGGREVAITILKIFDNKMFRELQPHYKNIKIPTLIIWGDKDRWIPPAHLEHFARDIPQAKQVTISDCGHAPQEEQPGEFNKAFFRFF